MSKLASHDCSSTFTFELPFSEGFEHQVSDPAGLRCTVSGGMGTKSKRLDEPSKLKWDIHVQPDGSVTIVLSVTAEIRGVLRHLRSSNPSPDSCAQKRVTAVAFALRS